MWYTNGTHRGRIRPQGAGIHTSDINAVFDHGKRAKASYDVKEGDIIEVSYGGRTLKLRVNDVREHALKADASSMYEIIES